MNQFFRIIVVIFFIGNQCSTLAQDLVDSIFRKFVNYGGFKSASVGLYVIDLGTNEVLANYNGENLLTPASTVKLFSTAFALEELGASFRPSTKLMMHGAISDSVLYGDLWVIGGGDVSLGSRYFESENRTKFLEDWITIIKEKGIRKVTGSIFVDGSDFGYEGAPDDWLWADLGNYYGAHFSGATVFDNTLEYHFKTGAVGRKASLSYTFPKYDSLFFLNNVMASSRNGDNVYIYGAPYHHEREARGTLPANQLDFVVKGSLPDPEFTLANEFRKALNANGVIIEGGARTTRNTPNLKSAVDLELLHEYFGRSIEEIAQVTNHESVNLFAEGLMRLTAFQKKKYGLHGEARKYMEEYWKARLNVSKLYLMDGSGLSRTNAVAAKTFVDLLVLMNGSSNQVTYLQTLPVAGLSGTLKNVAKNQPAHGKVYAKSGTMKRTKSYAGYIHTDNGNHIAFAFIVNNYSCSNRETTQQMELLMNYLVQKK